MKAVFLDWLLLVASMAALLLAVTRLLEVLSR